ncbi:MAG: methyltransferase domain-containing protein [Erysipelotrichaceae bacterium]|nr:methyltransferase domain-containing protein [Erysipelotrichaceae bacterium]
MFAREDVMKWQNEVCADLMRRSGIREGDTVIDFGCGRGHYAFAAAIAVGDTGMVYGLDTNAAVLEVLKQDAEYRHCTNVIPVKTEPGVNMPFPDSSADAVLIYDLIHETELRQPFLQEAHRVLKKRRDPVCTAVPYDRPGDPGYAGRSQQQRICSIQ